MPPKKLKNSQATNIATAAAVAACEDLMLCVLARLPVKSIIRFKSVCKSWDHLLSTQEFVKKQFKLSKESKKQSFLVHRVNRNRSNIISVFNFESDEKKAKILDYPFDYTPVGVGVGVGIGIGVSIVGCCNGLVCIKRGQEFVLWNPAMNLSKTVSNLKNRRDFEIVSLGFGYDAEVDDFKVVRIGFLEKMIRLRMRVSLVEVYSVNSDSWTTIDPGFQISKLWFDWIDESATVNGNPYWVGKVDVIKKEVLICFDMSKLVFKIVLLSSLDYKRAEHDIEFVDLNGSLGALIVFDFFSRFWRQENEESDAYVNVWVFDDDEQIWTKSHSVGPIEVKIINRVFRCLNDGRVLGMNPKRQLIVFNSETKCVKGLFNDGHCFKIYDYTESLVYIQGMERGIRRN
ncbi:hypothetical protein CASFOL_027786 [Castilleja foliolosa]|uniref:F-box domain-containing protein n=1 Tax=Castilleja foliolosa TaxID=1961234 RepID=A0ABD3CFT3_9LAMI